MTGSWLITRSAGSKVLDKLRTALPETHKWIAIGWGWELGNNIELVFKGLIIWRTAARSEVLARLAELKFQPGF